MTTKNKMPANALLYILIGALFCVFRTQFLQLLFIIAGALFIARGVLEILETKTYQGAIPIVIGILLIVGSMTIVEVFLIVFGALILVNGILKLVEMSHWKPTTAELLGAILTLLVGALLIAARWLMRDAFFVVLGVLFILNGVAHLIGTYRR